MRILSIRGGGIKGIVPAMVLDELEQIAGRPLADLFDLIVGTSTGGIIAIAAGLGMAASDMRNLYLHRGPAIFRRRWLLGLFAARYSTDALRSELRTEFGCALLGECRTKVAVTATDWDTSGAQFFKSWQHGFLSVVDVASATAAAPTYFDPIAIPPSQQFAGGRYVDGGLFANNPAPYGIVEAIKAGRALDQIHLVDLACPGVAQVGVGARRSAGGVFGVLPHIVDALIDAGVDAAAHASQKMLGDHYLQVQPLLYEASRRMDDCSGENLNALYEAGKRQALPLALRMAEFLGVACGH